MAVWSIVRRDSLAYGDRYDAEFYQPAYRRVRQSLAKCRNLSSCLVDIRYGVQAEPQYLSKGTEYVRAMNLNAPWIEGEILRINPNQIPNDNYRLRAGDILITRSGANCGAVGIITERFSEATYGSYTIRLRANDTVNPFVLFAFLLTDAGRTLTFQSRYGSAQPNLSIPYLRNLILVPEFSDALSAEVQRRILESVKEAHSEVELYGEAENELLDRLGWEGLRLAPVELSYLRDFTELSAGARADAEFFQPQYTRLRRQLSKRGAQGLANLVTRFDKGTQPDQYSDDGEVIVVKSKQVTGRGVSLERCERTTGEVWKEVAARLHAGDMVINSTGRGTLGRAAVIPVHHGKIVAAVDLVIARLRREIIHPQNAALFLNSPAGLAQSDQFQTGSSGQLHLYPQHFAQFLVYLPRQKDGTVDLPWQARLVAKVEAAFAANVTARDRLEEAKRLVEEAISR